MNAIEKIHGYLKFGVVLGLERMETLLGKLGDPHLDVDAVHVAGTNGKGSISRYIYEVMRAGGYSVGLYTSPYLEVFNERIEVDGEYITDSELEALTDKVTAAADEMVGEGSESPTEFEIVTAIAFLYFKEKGCDYVVLEVGLGGRGDSTNVIKAPLASVIASISYDHTDRLGNTISEIAGEKAGIIKEGCPVICAAKNDEAKAVLRKRATDLNAPFFDVTKNEVSNLKVALGRQKFDVEVLGSRYKGIEISMSGSFQIENAIAALACIDLLRQQGKLDIETRDVRMGMALARQIGRFEILSQDPLVIIDGAHNSDGSKALAHSVEKLLPGKKVLLTCGMLRDKDVEMILRNFRKFADEVIATEPDNDRKLTARELADRAGETGMKVTPVEDPAKAVELALSRRKEFDVLIFAGSLYLIGRIRRLIIESLEQL